MTVSEYIKYWDENVVEMHIHSDIFHIKKYFKNLNKDSLSYIDIGSNVGKIYDVLKRDFTIKECEMVEATKCLSDYTKEKYINEANVTIHHLGISNIPGMFKMIDDFFDKTNGLTSSLNLGLNKVQNTKGDTLCVKMDYFLKNINSIKPDQIDFIKIDTETKDYYIIKDLTNYLVENKIQPLIIFENNYFFELTVNEAQEIIDNFCNKCNYEPINVATSPGDICLIPVKN